MNTLIKAVPALISIVFLFSCDLEAADTLQLTDAIAKRRITVNILGNGGLSDKAVGLHVKNNISSSLAIEVSPGLRLKSEDGEVQDLIILENAIFAIAGKESKQVDVAAACIQLRNHGPKNGEKYTLGPLADGPLLEVAQLVAENEFFNSTAQAAVWGLTDQYSIDAIHGSDDVNLTWDLVKIVAVARRFNPPKKEEFLARQPVTRIVYSARADLVYHAPRKEVTSLKLFNQDGEEIRTYFQSREIHGGLHIYTVSINNILERAEQFTAKLLDGNGNEIISKTLDNEMPYEEVVQKITRVNFEYIVRKPSKVSMLVYDMNGKLLQEIFTNRSMGLSKRNADFKFFHALIEQDNFKVEVTNENGEVLHEEIVKI